MFSSKIFKNSQKNIYFCMFMVEVASIMMESTGIYHTWLRICAKSIVFGRVYAQTCFNNARKHRHLPHWTSEMHSMSCVFKGLPLTWPQECLKTPLFTKISGTSKKNIAIYKNIK